LKAIIIAADSAEPKVIQKYRSELPTVNNMISRGAFMTHFAYTGWNYNSAYKSEQCWTTVLTGLTPSEHNVNYKMGADGRPPEMKDLAGLQPFWEVLNANGLSVGLWHTDLCNQPVPINGYAVSAYYNSIETPTEEREAALEIQVCEKDRGLLSFLNGKPPSYVYPKTLSQLGYRFDELQANPDLAENVIANYHYQEAVAHFKAELEYFFGAMARAQRENPVDVLWFATPSTDRIAHFSMYDDNPDVLIECYKLLDRYMGELINEFDPEISVLISDHGQQNYVEFVKCGDKAVQREAFDSRDKVLWLKNGNVAFEGKNGALLFTSHAPQGTFIMSGRDIRNRELSNMRIVDIYPTLLEALKIKIPKNRSGYVADIYERGLINYDKLLTARGVSQKSIAFLQTHSVGLSQRFISEIFLENRFAEITVIGEEKYSEIFLNNPRVSGFISFEDYERANAVKSFDVVYTGIYNQSSGFMNHIKINNNFRKGCI
jgi:hypothetical protein